jgi:serine/threonine protein kinase
MSGPLSNNQYHTVSVGYNSFYIDQRYRNLKPIGDGSYGFVASATDTVTGNKVAIKKVKDTFLDVVDAKRILREIKLLNHFDKHENIITIYDIMSVPPNKEHFDDIYIVTNLMESDLERIIRSRQVLTDQHLQYFLFQILRGLKYVHSANVLHRDLKPSNLLVNANCDLALCDFGLARGFDAGVDMLTEYVVTRWYRPPELLLECSMYGKPVDVWSVGCIFAEVIVHEPFFRGDNPQHQLQVIVSKLGKPFVSCSQCPSGLTLRSRHRHAPQGEASLCGLEGGPEGDLAHRAAPAASVLHVVPAQHQPAGPGPAGEDAAVQPRRPHHRRASPLPPVPQGSFS